MTNRTERVAQRPVSAAAGIQALVAEPLARVEKMYVESLASPVAIVDELGGYVGDGRGKMVRPTLHLLSARVCGYDGPHDVLLATVLEFIHCATLVHDDIIDDATVRRGRPSVNARWGNNVTVLFGDYLFAKAMEMALGAGSLDVMQRLAEVTLRMTEGEMLQTRYEGRLDLSVPEYLDLVEKKTAALFGCCCELGGMLADETPERRRALREYGLNLGLAFQLIDDTLDFTGSLQTLGKPAANDLREGKATLAVIDLLASGSVEGRELAETIMSGDDASTEIERLNGLLRESGALERTRDRARGYAFRAIELIEPFDPSPAKEALRALPDLLLERDR